MSAFGSFSEIKKYLDQGGPWPPTPYKWEDAEQHGSLYSRYSQPTMSKRELNVGDVVAAARKRRQTAMDYQMSKYIPRSIATKKLYLNRGYERQSGEAKYMDTPLTQAAVLATTNTNAGIVTVNLIDPGSASFNRIGRKLILDSLRVQLRATFTSLQTGGITRGGVLRMVIVHDKQPAGVLPTFDSIFGRTVQNGTESTQFTDPLKYDNMNRFKILRDRLYTINPQIETNTGNYEVVDDVYLKLGRIQSVYSGQSIPQTIADLSSGAVYVIFRADANNASVETWAVESTSNARLKYFD